MDQEVGYAEAPSLSELNAELTAGAKTWRRVYACPACNEGSITEFTSIRHLPHSRCRSCGFTFANPLPSHEVLDGFYNSPFYNNYRRFEAHRMASERYFSISMYRDMRQLASWLGDNKAIKLLDYGCGPGAFLALLRDEFYFSNVEGLELSRISVEFARQHYGLTVASSTNELHSEFYDCVILAEVLEHIPNPGSIFKDLSELVGPGGHLLITTPAVDNLLGRFFPSHCFHYTAPSHVSLFTRRALTCLLWRFGFEIERIETDECFPELDKVALSLAYDLDFVSPRHDNDHDDVMYVPNKIGRLCGFHPERSPQEGPFRRGLQRLDRLLARKVWRRLPVACRTDHLYVLAQKCA